MMTIIMLPAGSSPMHTLPPSLLHSPPSFCVAPHPRCGLFKKRENMVEQDRDIKDICHVVSLCINIKEAEGRGKKREERRGEEKVRPLTALVVTGAKRIEL